MLILAYIAGVAFDQVGKGGFSVTFGTSDAAETIDGSLTFVLTVQYQAIEIQSNGTTWWII